MVNITIPENPITSVGECNIPFETLVSWCSSLNLNVGVIVILLSVVNLAFIIFYFFNKDFIINQMHNIISFNFAMSSILTYLWWFS